MAEIEDSLSNPSRTFGEERAPQSCRIRADIDRTRAEMDETIDAIDSKLTPGQLLLEAWGLFKGGSGAGASRLMRVAKRHPLPSLVVGAGLGWMLLESSRERGVTSGRRGAPGRGYGRYGNDHDDFYGDDEGYGAGERSGRLTAKLRGAASGVRDTASGAAHRVGDLASGAADKVGSLASGAAERVTGLASDTGEKVSELASEAGEKVSEAAGTVRERASHLGELAADRTREVKAGFWRMLDERPLSVGLATLAVGLIAGLSIPSTRKENELLGEKRDELLERAKQAGQEALDKGKQVARTALDTLKEEAEKQDLTPSGLVDKVRTVAEETAGAVKEEARKQGLAPEGEGQAGRPAEVEEPELARR